VAVTYCELYSLSRADVDSVMDGFPDIATEFYKAGAESWTRWGMDEVLADSGEFTGGNTPTRPFQERGQESPVALQAILAYQANRRQQRLSAHTPL